MPSQKIDWHEYSPVLTPPRGFVQELHDYDSKLEVLWNNKLYRWQIIRDKRFIVLTTDHLDKRDMHALYEGDLQRFGNSEEFERYIDSYNNNIRKSMENKQREERDELAERGYVEHMREHRDVFAMGG